MPRLVNAARYASERFRLRRKHTDVCVPARLVIDRRRHAISPTRYDAPPPPPPPSFPCVYIYVCEKRSNRSRDIYWRAAITEATICHAAVLITQGSLV